MRDHEKEVLRELLKAVCDYLYGAMTSNLKSGEDSPKYTRLRKAMREANNILRDGYSDNVL